VKRRWLGWGIVVIVAVVFVRLGFWQISRLHERQASNRHIESNLADRVVPLEEILSQSGDVEYRHVVVEGEYLPRFEVLLRNRSYEGSPGYHVLTPLELTSGSTVLVDRGWVPLGIAGPPVMPPPPEGLVEVTGVIRTSKTQGSGLGPKDPATGTLTAVFWPDLERLAGQMPGPLEPVYVELRYQVPAGGSGQPIPASDPILTDGPHLSYTVQWFAFAAIAIVGYFLLTRKRRPVDRDA